MLQTANCKHCLPLPIESCMLCTKSTPEPLLTMTLDYILDHMDTFCETEQNSECLRLHKNVALPLDICERLLTARLNRNKRHTRNFIYIFRDRHSTRLRRVKIRNCEDLDDKSLKILLEHMLVELELTNCSGLSSNSLKYISAYGSRLQNLVIGDNTNVFPEYLSEIYMSRSPQESVAMNEFVKREYIIMTPFLRRLTIRKLEDCNSEFFNLLLKPMENLTHLDLSNCGDLADLCYTLHLTNLTSLILYNVERIELMIPSICKLKTLKHLDISQSKEGSGNYKYENQLLALIVESLPKLVSLDISGTNLAGRGVAEVRDMQNCRQGVCDIPGLTSRVYNPLQFLGLYDAHSGACLRHDIPANLVSRSKTHTHVSVSEYNGKQNADRYLHKTSSLQNGENLHIRTIKYIFFK